nr:717_t:CDS:2 [Entrophospora candida]
MFYDGLYLKGGFDFNIAGQCIIRTPDVAFMLKDTYWLLDHHQQWTFKGQPFMPTCVVEVTVVQEGYQEFNDLDQKFTLKWTCQLNLTSSESSSESDEELQINCPECEITFTLL